MLNTWMHRLFSKSDVSTVAGVAVPAWLWRVLSNCFSVAGLRYWEVHVLCMMLVRVSRRGSQTSGYFLIGQNLSHHSMVYFNVHFMTLGFFFHIFDFCAYMLLSLSNFMVQHCIETKHTQMCCLLWLIYQRFILGTQQTVITFVYLICC